MATPFSGDRPDIVACLVIVIALALALFFAGLGSWALSDPDEPYYAVPAAEMLHSGTWQVPVFRGQPWFDKPILFYWLVLAGYRIFGVSETSARFFSAVAGLGGLLVVLEFGRRMGLVGWSRVAPPVILATFLGYILGARAAVTDMTLTVFISLGMLAVARRLSGGALRWAGLAGIAFGLAALTKGPVAILIPMVALTGYRLASGRRDIASAASLAMGAAGFLLSAGPWYLYMALAYPDLLLTKFLGEGNLGRFLEPEHSSFPLYYLVILAVTLLPWSAALPAALARAAGSAVRGRESDSGRQPAELYLLCWFGAVILIFSAAASKLPSYVLPAFPPAALMLAAYWREQMSRARPRAGLLLWMAWSGVALALTAAGALAWGLVEHGWQVALTPAIIAGAILVAGSVLLVIVAAKGALPSLLAVQTTTSASTMLVILVAALPALEPFHSTAPLVRELRQAGLAQDVVGAYRVSDVSLDYYLGWNPPRAERLKDVIETARQRPGGIWIVRTRDVDALLADARMSSELVTRGPNRSAVRLSTSFLPGGS